MQAEVEPLLIASIGAQTPLGLDAQTTAASYGGGIKRLSHNIFFRNHQHGDPFLIGELPIFDGFDIQQRMVSMAHAAIVETLSELGQSLDSPLPVILSLPPQRPGFGSDQKTAVANAILQNLPFEPHPDFQITLESAHCGGMHAAAIAYSIMHEHSLPICLVGAVDSALESNYLNWLADHDRLAGENKPHGMVPGEGAAFILFATRDGLECYDLKPLAKINSLCNALEPNPWYENRPTTGEGLTDAILSVLYKDIKTGLCYTDLNGENWRHEEWQFAFVRGGEYMQSPLDIRHPADSYGDVGAATALLLMTLASYSFMNRCENHSTALICTTSDTRPWRSACFLQAC